MMPLNELIHWTACSDALPDCEINVLCYDAETELVCEGWIDGEDAAGCAIWRDVTAVQLGTVTHWADMPAGPAT